VPRGFLDDQSRAVELAAALHESGLLVQERDARHLICSKIASPPVASVHSKTAEEVAAMLVLTRKLGESVRVGRDVEILSLALVEAE